MSLHVGYIESKRKGDILTRITSDVAEIEQSVVTTFEAVLRDPITIVFFLYLMIGISWQLTLFMLLMIPVAAIVISSPEITLTGANSPPNGTTGEISSIGIRPINQSPLCCQHLRL